MREMFDAIAAGTGGRSRGELWAVVLAGGEGRRLQDLSRRLYGYPRPKQYCAFGPGPTLLERTLRRTVRAIPQERTLVITSRTHRAEANECLAGWRVRRVEQPCSRDTLPGILLPLLCFLPEDPGATVVILPSDHFVDDDDAFMAAVLRAAEDVEDEPDRVVLLGAVAREPEAGLGWIVPSPGGRVARFREKPEPAEAAALLREGALASTFVMVAKARTLAALVARRAPLWWASLCEAVFSPDDLEAAYERLPPTSFSRVVLEAEVASLSVRGLGAVRWSDIGTPERLARALAPPPTPSVAALFAPRRARPRRPWRRAVSFRRRLVA